MNCLPLLATQLRSSERYRINVKRRSQVQSRTQKFVDVEGVRLKKVLNILFFGQLSRVDSLSLSEPQYPSPDYSIEYDILTGRYMRYVCVFTVLITTLVLCVRSQDLEMSVSVRRVHVVFSTSGFNGGGKPCRKTRETASLRRGIQKASRTQPASNPSHRCAS